ncbi:4-amino-4-deoxy-L-arabinose-phospho-UDP flippase [Pseudomonas agarici]|uniref:Probable 4-amino-4-deoxy-L-arabinose-phosphoundecaprenol flippase subunit ArnF n=1 Tax=Pseudomonas agarici TaxID=46677 RepID=A0A0X1SYE9_PSEAA|nr:4-amino-4-deoxy-L-arabinose-phosphoundecaprenol flippase subunit ArnF [Pseudomonas agarici]AMB84864.1 4-amino-4-deoxy-L-arabinose-phospho-UDP flippase [Pseudomonas agarici]NWB93100.1 4-amino-4-deoxy-L-arabinose-phosphoundecaprenol flippase subunit ArnF [Pseudomonas agarici]NWC08527.1 4-amino-4-deoxy-L-arabinose-phosphoundecaprenol flippase subunit ArnF [Pseudomonas agarici]SEK69880.1 undecaprenyl phosphate-alpha-L-ara4N flippase subunit ArnF [Pseudomonas agarici]
MNLCRGFTFAGASVLLVSGAQLGMRWGMTHLPEPSQWLDTLMIGDISWLALGVVGASILAYALSMLCWLATLRDLPLGRAYSLLSVSYALVYLLAASLPFFHESFSLSKTLGVALVILGVLTINSPRTPRPRDSV